MKHAWQHVFVFCLTLLLFMGLTTAVSPQTPSALLAKLDAPLQEMVASNDIVDIIVRQEGSATDLQATIKQFGGTITKDLPIIDGFAATLPAQALIPLAQQPTVAHISHDTAVHSTAESYLVLETVTIANVDEQWQTVALKNSYASMVAVCSATYSNNSKPFVVRLRNVDSGSSFDLRLQNPSNHGLNNETVHCLVIEEGAYTLP
ncbi:MAG: hypothetical protein AAF614_13910, partial [Chloroflexota bacterium]